MNIYRLMGDFCHLFAMVYLLFSIISKKSSAGISGKSQLLLAMAFIARYLDLSSVFVSYYNESFKFMFIGIYLLINFSIYVVFNRTYDSKNDAFLSELLLFPAFMLAVFVNYQVTTLEILWTFSEYLEAVAQIPQFYMIMKTKKITKNICIYLSCLGIYKGLYIANWVYRYNVENRYDVISEVSGLVYVGIFIVAALVLLCSKIEVETEERRFLRSNIFFISDHHKMEQDAEKNELITT